MTASTAALDFPALWAQALPFPAFVAASDPAHRGLWDALHRLAVLPDWAPGLDLSKQPRHLLVLAEDWCGDASNTIPALQKLVDRVPGLELRILRRDEHPAVMDRYLTGTARAIPIVIALDGEFRELGHWGPRPTQLQEWAMAHRDLSKPERYPIIRKWYARDRGHTTMREVLAAAGVTLPAPASAPTAAPA